MDRLAALESLRDRLQKELQLKINEVAPEDRAKVLETLAVMQREIEALKK
jgi:hypothetical protein